MAHDATIVWFRQDLRVADNPTLTDAAKRGGPVIPVYVWAPEEEGEWPPGSASRFWLHHSLLSLQKRLEKAGSRLIVRRGNSLEELESVARSAKAGALFWNRRYEPAATQRDGTIKSAFKDRGLEVKSFNASLLLEPWQVETKQGGPYKVFTPFWKACLQQLDPPFPLPAPREIPAPHAWPRSLRIEALGLQPGIDWAAGIREAWAFGEATAQARLEAFVDELLALYPEGRDQPGTDGTSRMSPYLHFGEIGPRQIWHAVQGAASEHDSKAVMRGAEKFLSELGWREFSHHLLYRFPRLPKEPMQEKFAAFPWQRDDKALEAWKKGRTGFPIVDGRHARALENRVDAQPGSKWLWRHFLPKTCLFPGNAERHGSGIPWSMPTWPTIPRDGSGRPGAEQMQRRTFASSIRSARASAMTQRPPTSADGCPKSPPCRTDGFTGRGRRPQRSFAKPVSTWIQRIRRL